VREDINRKESQMSDRKPQNRVSRVLIVGAVVLGVLGGSYGIATAASGSDPAQPAAAATAAAQPNGQRPWGGQRSDETLLTGDAASKVTAAANARVSGGTVVRVETDADGNAAYEAHMTDANGSPVTVYVNKSFDVVGVERR
jgi:hypothetical protein